MDNNELKDFFEEMRNSNANLLLISENILKKLENCKIEKEKLEESLNKMIVLNQNLINEINNNHIVIKSLSNDIKIVNNELSILKNENINNKKDLNDKCISKNILTTNTTKIISENIEKLKNEIMNESYTEEQLICEKVLYNIDSFIDYITLSISGKRPIIIVTHEYINANLYNNQKVLKELINYINKYMDDVKLTDNSLKFSSLERQEKNSMVFDIDDESFVHTYVKNTGIYDYGKFYLID